MEIVDSHVHVGLTKYVPVEVLLAQMQVAGVDRALLVQYGGCYDNAYLGMCIERYPGRFAALGAVDPADPDAPEQIRRDVAAYHLRGLRISAAVQRTDIWNVIDELGLVVSLTGRAEQLTEPQVQARIRRYVHTAFRIEHLGLPRTEGSPDEPPFSRLLEYADLPNVFITLSGFYAFGERYPYPEAVPFVQRAVERFGARRMLWGSDFPPVTSSQTYGMTLDMLHEWDVFSQKDLAWILGRTAVALLRF